MWYGQFETDRVIASYFPEGHVGLAVEVGAYDGIKGSNSLYFEKAGWDVLCIEPNPYAYAKLFENRDCLCYNMACSDISGIAKLKICRLKSGIQSSLTSLEPDERLIRDYGHDIVEWEEVEVKVHRLTNILRLISTPHLDNVVEFISIDTEGTELDVLKGLDLQLFDVKLLVVENNYQDSEIDDYLSKQGYKLDQRYRINDFYVKS